MKIRARDIMSRDDIAIVGPDRTLSDLEQLLSGRSVSGVPVVNKKKEVVGVVSQSDVGRFIARELKEGSDSNGDGDLREKFKKMQVRDIMQSKLYTVDPDDSLPTVANVLRRQNVHRALVMKDKILLGIISSFDLIRVLETPGFVKEFWGQPVTEGYNIWGEKISFLGEAPPE